MTIKPCERCGKTFNSYFYETVCYKCQTEKNLEVECNECRAKSDEYGAELEAIAAWNRRADAVQVVRCVDCKYRELAKVNCKGYTICPASGMEITDDDYCSYGERKGDRK